MGRRKPNWAEETLSCEVGPTEAVANPVGSYEAGMTLQSCLSQGGDNNWFGGHVRQSFSNIDAEWTSGLLMLPSQRISCGLTVVLQSGRAASLLQIRPESA